MGCEFCQNDNRENIEFKLAGDGKRPVELKNNLEQIDKERYYSILEERLNEKYSIPQKVLEEYKEKKTLQNYTLNTQTLREELNNKNKNNITIDTLNLYSNNNNEFNSRNRKKVEENKTIENITNITKENEEKENIFDSGSNLKKETFEDEIEELKKNLRKKKGKKK